MKLTFVAVLGLAVLAAPAAFAGPTEGQGLYEARCKMCHGSGMGGAPLQEKLAALESDAVVEKLTNGTMAAMAAGMSETDKRDIAVFLTKKGLPAKGDLPEVKPAAE
jgi:mono/diheme cytochrome c family protein